MMSIDGLHPATATIAVTLPEHNDLNHADIFATIESAMEYDDETRGSPPVK